ncbi:MAG: hypothetical protein QW505_06115 [Thermoplasmata archaeon]
MLGPSGSGWGFLNTFPQKIQESQELGTSRRQEGQDFMKKVSSGIIFPPICQAKWPIRGNRLDYLKRSQDDAFHRLVTNFSWDIVLNPDT